ncbi:hypothetical protein SAMN05192561_10848 [Halopenitus malekzadehii]|uniref:Uncharacterized protein n=2 Tax=Halopenitus malekzadehii TaxID=1267564 RepID=A0A1H6JC69_9EURY|nr:hypothetical protein SAMN05192561_10848 [Halopenitus malekzadehii]
MEITTTGDPVAIALAALAVGLFAVALIAMSTDRLTAAGMSFLAASLVIYLRENRVADRNAEE